MAGAGSFGPNKPPLANIERRIWKQICFVLFCFFFICNRSIFAGKDIFIAGGGHSAADWAISLSEIANKKNLVYKRNQFRDAKENLRQLKVIVETGNTELVTVCQHGYIILNRSNNWQISIEISAPLQAVGFFIKDYFGISNIVACR